ncbi:MAG: hypothetical protein EAZ47_04205 [Bacteroidetes bacterium]|nr:MAG: hypothetical protein EAY72_05135 [Bacteroidota bacterium]TAF94221.1 MAG: hypothetical protein EAZ47_04205 [Bacteroidota bacterium]
MQETKEIWALLHLLDEPDEDNYVHIAQKIITYGKDIIPNLENIWENTQNNQIQDRIERLIHSVQFSDLQADLQEWKNGPYHDLLFGCLLLAKYPYPDLAITPIIQQLERLKRSIWLELNNYLTPLEQANVMHHSLFKTYGLQGKPVSYTQVDDFLLHKALSSKKGNVFANGILYLVMADLLDIPVKAIPIPRQFILAFFKPSYQLCGPHDNLEAHISFFVDANSGEAYSHADIATYLQRIGLKHQPQYFIPYTNQQILAVLLKEMAKCFQSPNVQYKQAELLALAEMFA